MKWITDYHTANLVRGRRDKESRFLTLVFADDTTQPIGYGSYTESYPKTERLVDGYIATRTVGLWEIETEDDDRLIASGYRPMFIDGTDVIGMKRTWFPVNSLLSYPGVLYYSDALHELNSNQR